MVRDGQQAIPNTLLYDARRRIPSRSPLRSGKCMTRRELADAVNVAMRELYPEHTGIAAFYVDERWIGKLERGEHHWPTDIRRAALRHVLYVDTDAEIGLYPQLQKSLDLPLLTDTAAIPENRLPTEARTTLVLRHVASHGDSSALDKIIPSAGFTFAETIGAQAVVTAPVSGDVGRLQSPFDGLTSLSIETPVPTSIGWADVDHVRYITRALALSENTYGGGFSGQAAAAQLRHSAQLIKVRASKEVRRAMHEAVGNLSGVVGFSAFDVANFQSARVCFDFELWCAEEAGSWPLRACALGDMARLAMYLEDYDDALSLIEFAQVRSDLLTARTRAMLCAVRARLLALLGRDDEARSEVIRSDEHFADRERAEDPPWISYYDEAEHKGSTARAFLPIAVRTRDLGMAVPRLQEAVRLHDDDHPRSRLFSRTRLASLVMKIGDPREAACIGQVAVTEASAVRSTRLRSELERLASLAAVHEKIAEVAELRHEILDSSGRFGAY